MREEDEVRHREKVCVCEDEVEARVVDCEEGFSCPLAWTMGCPDMWSDIAHLIIQGLNRIRGAAGKCPCQTTWELKG
jgi:hypothetical protein